MEVDIIFQLELDYLTTPYPSLRDKAISVTYNKEKKKFLWLFYMKDIDSISSIIGKPITFENQQQEVERLIKLCPPLKSRIGTEIYKGVGEYTYIEQPEIFMVGEWQKNPKTSEPEQAWQRIPKEVVLVNWDIIQGYPKDKWIKIRTQAEHVCRKLGFDAVFRDSGTFDWSKFTGLHRRGHLPYVYYPIKILANLGVIEYSRVGKIKRIRDRLELQYHFVKKVPDSDIIPKEIINTRGEKNA